MGSISVFVGLDYHDEGIEVNVMDAGGEVLATRHCPNDWKAVAAVVPPGPLGQRSFPRRQRRSRRVAVRRILPRS